MFHNSQLIFPFFSARNEVGPKDYPPPMKSPKLPAASSPAGVWGFLDYFGAVMFAGVIIAAVILALCCYFKCIKSAGPVSPV